MDAARGLLTVLLPVRNAAPYLGRALDSLRAQTHGAFTVLAIDDGSTDASGEILQGLRDERFRVIRREARGLVATLNEGLALASTPYVARMDADDRSMPERFARQLDALQADPGLVLIGSQTRVIDAGDAPVGRMSTPTGDAGIRRALAVMNCFSHGATMFRRDAALSAGGYRADAPLVEDYDLWRRLAQRGRVANHADTLYEWRATAAGTSRSGRAAQRDASERLGDDLWQAWFGDTGPAPRDAWPEIWRGRLDPVFACNLHLLFARGYAKRGARGLALSHARAALALHAPSLSAWAYLGGLTLPASWFIALEDRARTLVERRRGW
jgi:glycosyltransferase involved in cell wall biosynthesis